MTNLSRLSVPLLAGAALFVLAACGQGSQPAAPPAPSEAAEASAGSSATGEHETHGEDEDGHEDHEHAHDAEDAHDHDHADSHAGGSAHVHGIADLALVLEGSELTAEIISPLANFGLSEADGVITDEVVASLPGLIVITGGNCIAAVPSAGIDTGSGHTDAQLSFSWTCADPAGVSAARFEGFSAYSGFERINAVFISGAVQKAAELTPSAPAISLK